MDISPFRKAVQEVDDMDAIVPITVEALPAYSGLDGENADNYYRASQRRGLLSGEVVSPFRGSMKASTSYNDSNIPTSEIELPVELGELRFVAKVTPTKKRPGYKDVVEDLDCYLRTRLAEYRAGNRPVGIFTIEEQPYISAHDVLARIKKSKGKVLAEGVKIEITDPDLPSGVDSVVVPLGMNLSQLTEGNAMRYLAALSISGDFESIIRGFEEDLIGLTGFSDEHAPGQTEHMYRQLGWHIFHVASVPYQSTSYGKVIGGLDAEPAKKDLGKGGDLVLVTTGVELPRLKVYDTKQRDGDHLVRLNGLLKRMDALVKDNTETKVRQKPIDHYPVV